uniref:Uncharacterized protein n=1 Tax=Megaselia scalaris TaxID=36166 RepID=T1GWT2_MEGSC
FIATPEILSFEDLIDAIWKIPNITFNIHTEDFPYSEQNEVAVHHHVRELLIVTTKSLRFRYKLRKHIKSRLVILVTSKSTEQILERPYSLGLFNGIIFQNGTPFIFIGAENNIVLSFICPEISWPFFSVNEKLLLEEENNFFPLLIPLENRISGVFAYFAYSFRDYLYDKVMAKLIEFKKPFSERIVDEMIFSFVFTRRSDGYPLFSTKQCLMLPILDEISIQEYLRKPFTNWLWLLLVIFIIYISGILRGFIHEDSFQCFFESLTISCGSIYKGINSRNSRNRIIYLFLFLYGFVVWNLYSAKISSFLTTINRGRNLRTINDINNEKLVILASIPLFRSDKSLKWAFPEIYSFMRKFPDKRFLHNVSKNEFNELWLSMNNSFGYLIADYSWSYVSLIQSLLSRKLFSFSNLCPDKGFIYPTYFISKYVKLDETMDLFHMRVLENLKYFTIAWYIVFLGLGISAIIFILENLIHEHY